MNRLFSLAAIAALIIVFTGCEKCSDCTLEIFEGVCACEYQGSVNTTTYPGLRAEEVADFEASCEFVPDCVFSTTSTEQNDEVCGRKKEVEDTTSDLEKSGWECSEV